MSEERETYNAGPPPKTIAQWLALLKAAQTTNEVEELLKLAKKELSIAAYTEMISLAIRWPG